MFERLEWLIKDKIHLLEEANILLVGTGGVGGYALECLVRSGIKHITIIDYDTFELSNLNRQIAAYQSNVGQLKVKEYVKRCLLINKNIDIKDYSFKIDAENIEKINLLDYNFILDCCDDVKAKILLITEAFAKDIPIISCMGTAKRLCPEKLKITTLNKTFNDPLAKVLRKQLSLNYHKLPVIWSEELPQDIKKLGTVCCVPMSAGALMASYVINKIIN